MEFHRHKPAPIDWPAIKSEILAKLDIAGEYRDLGLRLCAETPNPKGLIVCHAMDREDTHPSAFINVKTGIYHDSGSESLNFWDFCLKHTRKFGRHIDVVRHYAARTGVEIGEFKFASKDRIQEAEYVYQNELGHDLFVVTKYRLPTGKKEFSQRPANGKPCPGCMDGVRLVPYKLPELIAADPGETIWIVEGEKDVDRLVREKLIATCNPMGVGKWKDEFSVYLANHQVVVIPDHDDAGLNHAHAVCKSLKPHAASVKLLELPDLPKHGDVSDWLDQGGTIEELGERGYKAKIWAAQPSSNGDGKGHIDGLMTTRASEIKAMPFRWLVPGFLPLGKLVVVAGDGGLGKSIFTIATAGMITRGKPCFGLEYDDQEAADVLLVSCEDDFSDTVIPRLIAAGADLARIERVDGVRKDGEPVPFGLAHYEALESHLEKNPAIKLVIIDPAGAYVGRAKVDDHHNSELQALLGPLADLASRRGVTIVLVCHVNKSASLKAAYRVMGSVGYVNSARAVFIVGPDPDNPERRVIIQTKGNLGLAPPARAFGLKKIPDEMRQAIQSSGALAHLNAEGQSTVLDQMVHVVWEAGAVELSADDIMGRETKDKGATITEKAGAWLVEFLKDGPRFSEDVFLAGKKAGFSKHNLYDGKQLMEIRAKPNGFSGPFRWGLGDPEEWPPTIVVVAEET